MPDTCGLIGSVSSESANLQQSLESKLAQRLNKGGSTLFNLTWKRKATPAGRSYCQLVASVRRISGNDYGLWPMPCQQDGPKGGPSQGIDRLPGAASLVGWPTPTLHDAERGGQAKRAAGETRHGSNLQDFAMLASWPSPSATDEKNAGGPSWAASRGKKGLRLNDLVVNRGPISNSSHAATERRGQLNPAFSLWLMGYPPEWENCAPQATLSSRNLRRNL